MAGSALAAASALLIAWLVLQWGILPHIGQWRGALEAHASRAVGATVEIGHVAVRSGAWMPAFELRDVRVSGRDGRPGLTLPRIDAVLSPRSLIALEPRLAQLVIDGAELDVRRDAQGRFFVAGMPLGGDGRGADGDDATEWLLRQQEIVVRGGTLRWTDELRGDPGRDAGANVGAGTTAGAVEALPALFLRDVQVVLRNGLREHSIRIDATPPAASGSRFVLIGRFAPPLLGREPGWQHWSGTAYAHFPRVDAAELGRRVDLPLDVVDGDDTVDGNDSALRGWFDVVDGKPVGATVDLALRSVTLRRRADGAAAAPAATPNADIAVLRLEQVQGRLVASRRGEQHSVALQGISFAVDGAPAAPAGALRLQWRQAPGQPMAGGEFSADRVDLGLAARLAAAAPWAAGLRGRLEQLGPQGVARDVSARWDGPLDAPDRYRARGSIAGLTLQAAPSPRADDIGRPGIVNAGLSFDAHERGGTAQLDIAAGALDLPGVFAEPRLPLDRLSARLAWQIDPVASAPGAPKLSVQIDDARFANADARGQLRAAWTTGPGSGVGRDGRFPGRLSLQSTLTDGVATRAARYLPLGISEPARRYVERAVRGGSLRDVRFHVDGRLWDFPFPKGRGRDGDFRIAGTLADVTLAYVPDEPVAPGLTGPAAAAAATATAGGAALRPATVGESWPVATGVAGELLIDRTRLEFRQGRGQLGGAAWSRVQGHIADLTEPVLVFDGQARGPLTGMLDFVNASPVGRWTDAALARAAASGEAELKLALKLPLDTPEDGSVAGSVALAGNEFRVTPDSPQFRAATGRVDFSERGFTIAGARAQVFGGPASFDGGSQADGSLRFGGQGVASAEGLRQAPELGLLARVAGAFHGETAYRLKLGIVDGRLDIDVHSDLLGLASSLPTPLDKAAATALPMRYRNAAAAPPAGSSAAQDTLQLEVGNLLQAHYRRDVSTEPSRVLSGGIGVMQPAPQPNAGVAANVRLPALDVDDWEAAASRYFGADAADLVAEPGVAGALPAVTKTVTAGAPAAPAASADASFGGYAPDAVALQIGRLHAGPRRLDKLVAGATRRGGVWRANVDAEQLAGYLEYRPPRPGAPGDGVYARLARLSLPKTDADAALDLLGQAPASLPALDVVVDEFELRGTRLGRLEVDATNRPAATDGAPRDWLLSNLKLTTPEARFTATGLWSATAAATGAAPGPRRSTMNFELAVDDSGALLDRLGQERAIQGGKGRLSGQVGWTGSPLEIDVPSLAGRFKVALDTGQFLKVDPGAARLLGVLSLQALPRRFSLDFRDLFGRGFAFDNITGDVRIEQGQARTNNLRMRGVQAVVLLDGSASIADETQDLRVWVVPQINAGTASLAYAVINPAIGLGTFLAQVVLRKPLAQAGTREFRIHGPWRDPQVDAVARSFGDAIPPIDAPDDAVPAGNPAADAAAAGPAAASATAPSASAPVSNR